MNKLITSLPLAALTSTAILLSLASCRKKEDTIAYIKVLGPDSQPVDGARVVLFGENTDGEPHFGEILVDTSFTDETGIAMFDYTEEFQLGQAGFLGLDIEASKDTLFGAGFIQVEAETESSATVYLNP